MIVKGRDVQSMKMKECRGGVDTLETRVFDKCSSIPETIDIVQKIVALRDLGSCLSDLRREIFWIYDVTKQVLVQLLTTIRTIIKHYLPFLNPDDGIKIVDRHRVIFLMEPMDDSSTFPQAILILQELLDDLIGNCDTLVYANVLALSKVFGIV